jgi:hypothetical protein
MNFQSLARGDQPSFVRSPKNYQDLYKVVTERMGGKWPKREDFWFQHFRGIVCVKARDQADFQAKMGKLDHLMELAVGLDIFWIYHVQVGGGESPCGEGDYNSYFDIVGPTSDGVAKAIDIVKKLMESKGFPIDRPPHSISIRVNADRSAALHRNMSAVLKNVYKTASGKGVSLTGVAMSHNNELRIEADGAGRAAASIKSVLERKYKSLGQDVRVKEEKKPFSPKRR